jgi:hypothetical protein
VFIQSATTHMPIFKQHYNDRNVYFLIVYMICPPVQGSVFYNVLVYEAVSYLTSMKINTLYHVK